MSPLVTSGEISPGKKQTIASRDYEQTVSRHSETSAGSLITAASHPLQQSVDTCPLESRHTPEPHLQSHHFKFQRWLVKVFLRYIFWTTVQITDELKVLNSAYISTSHH